MLHIGIIEHGRVYDATPWHLSAGRAAKFAVADHDIVVRGARRLDAHLSEHQQHHRHETVEGKAYVILTRHERPHQIVPVGIHTASPTLPLIHPDTMLSTVVQVHLVLHYLIAPIDHAGLHLPQHEQVVVLHVLGQIILHRQIERQRMNPLVRQHHVLHGCKYITFLCNIQIKP